MLYFCIGINLSAHFWNFYLLLSFQMFGGGFGGFGGFGGMQGESDDKPEPKK